MNENWEKSKKYAAWPGCRPCAHYQAGGSCAAFPKGIPLPIVAGRADHMVERPGQVPDVLFKRKAEDQVFHRDDRIGEVLARIESYVEARPRTGRSSGRPLGPRLDRPVAISGHVRTTPSGRVIHVMPYVQRRDMAKAIQRLVDPYDPSRRMTVHTQGKREDLSVTAAPDGGLRIKGLPDVGGKEVGTEPDENIGAALGLMMKATGVSERKGRPATKKDVDLVRSYVNPMTYEYTQLALRDPARAREDQLDWEDGDEEAAERELASILKDAEGADRVIREVGDGWGPDDGDLFRVTGVGHLPDELLEAIRAGEAVEFPEPGFFSTSKSPNAALGVSALTTDEVDNRVVMIVSTETETPAFDTTDQRFEVESGVRGGTDNAVDEVIFPKGSTLRVLRITSTGGRRAVADGRKANPASHSIWNRRRHKDPTEYWDVVISAPERKAALAR